MPSEHLSRRERLAAILRERGLAAAVVTDLVNVRYLTGFTGSNGAVRVGEDGSAVFVTDGRYGDQAAEEAPDVEVVVDRDLLGALASGTGGAQRIGVETHALTVDDYDRAREAFDGVELVSLGAAVEQLRVVKDDGELDALRRACDISVQALAEVLAGPLLGRTEREIARDLEWTMYGKGAEAIAFETIVASGPNTAIPHHDPTDRPVGRDELLKIDFGARVDGYHADCTRTVVVGKADAWQREVYEVVRTAQQAGVDACVEGAICADVDALVRQVLADAGWLEAFTTGLGHGVGLRIHEDPFLSARAPARLERRTALTMEPGIYVAGLGGVRIEDTLVVTDGAPELLTVATKDLLELA
ncbi:MULTISPECIES: M24 family metallopeptidase [Mumia]|uniref:M24 family metallopeptidase n=1 Tax=Mumia TaxID=1546255 RepID=UPI001421779D|nr:MULTISPECIES: Xaa-Pro peptidase family protein [unclassified Mumia]QMW67972.1 aminopeptidase P family protein [Mumia sp. ZJ1417]